MSPIAKSSRLKCVIVPISEATMTAEIDGDPKRPVIMVVDDDERVIADTLSLILSRSGYTILTAYDGRSAFDLAQTVPPEMLISDVVMPGGMSGIDLAILVSQTVPDCKILLFSGQAATVDLLETARGMGHEFTALNKPVHPTELLARISQCLQPPVYV